MQLTRRMDGLKTALPVTARPAPPPPPIPIHSLPPTQPPPFRSLLFTLLNYCLLRFFLPPPLSPFRSISLPPLHPLVCCCRNGHGLVGGGGGDDCFGGGGGWVQRGGGGGGGGARGASDPRAAAGLTPDGDRGVPARRGHGEVRGGAGGALHGAVRGRAAVQRHRGRGDHLRPDRRAVRGRRQGPLPLVRRPEHQRRRAVVGRHLLRRRRRLQALPALLLRGPAALHARPAHPHTTGSEEGWRISTGRWRGVAKIMGPDLIGVFSSSSSTTEPEAHAVLRQVIDRPAAAAATAAGSCADRQSVHSFLLFACYYYQLVTIPRHPHQSVLLCLSSFLSVSGAAESRSHARAAGEIGSLPPILLIASPWPYCSLVMDGACTCQKISV